MRLSRFLIVFALSMLIFLCFTRYHFRSVHKKTFSSSILSKRIDQRLQRLSQQFAHVNLSMFFGTGTIDHRSPRLIYRCREWCGGWGDRLRGITSVFILAVLTERKFSIDMPFPCEIKRFLKPNIYDWRWFPTNSQRRSLHIETTRNKKIAEEIYQKIALTDFTKDWSKYDDIYMTTNSDYITPVLKNPFLRNRVHQLNLRESESNQVQLFPIIYEYLFQPHSELNALVDRVLRQFDKDDHFTDKSTCLHLRIGKNPSIIYDNILPYREQMSENIVRFLKSNLTIDGRSSIFITSDSMDINQYFKTQFGDERTLTIPGPIIHIDRVSSKDSYEQRCQGFLKVLADFYVLGECSTLIMARSGFSQWASRRRIQLNPYDRLFLYCRGVYQITGSQWKRPHTVC